MGAVAAKVEEVKSMLEAAAIAATTEDAHTASAEMHERLDQRRAKREGTLTASDDHGLIALRVLTRTPSRRRRKGTLIASDDHGLIAMDPH